MMSPAQLPMVMSTCVFGAVPDAVCTVVGGIGSITGDIVEVVQNPFRWLYHHTLGVPIPQSPADPGWGACQQDWSQPACPKLIDSLKPGNITLASEWPRLYGAFAVSGVFLASTACVIRIVRAVFDERVAGMHLVVDNIVRLLVVTAVLLAPSPGSSLLLNVMTWATAASGSVAVAAATAITGAFNTNLDLGAVVGNIASVGFGVGGVGDFLVAIPLLLAALGFVYILALYLLRIIQLVFAVATAPIFVGLAAYDPRGRFVQWWVDLFTSAMVLPLVLSVCGSLTGAIALLLLGNHPGAPGAGGAVEAEMRTLLACFAVLGGVWMTGKAAHGLAWRSFSHGGITGAVTAVSTSVTAVPNLAGSVSSVLHRGGGAAGGLLGRAASASRVGVAVAPRGSVDAAHTEAVIAAAAAGQEGALGQLHGRSADALASPPADFAAHPAAAAFLHGAAGRVAFNRVLSAAVAQYAVSDAGHAAVTAATAHLDAANPTESARVAEYTRLAAADPVLGNALAGAAVAGLLHNQPPDVAPILRDRIPVAP